MTNFVVSVQGPNQHSGRRHRMRQLKMGQPDCWFCIWKWQTLLFLSKARINILDDDTECVNSKFEISHFVVPYQQSGCPNQPNGSPLQQNGCPNQQNGSFRIDKMRRANYMKHNHSQCCDAVQNHLESFKMLTLGPFRCPQGSQKGPFDLKPGQN